MKSLIKWLTLGDYDEALGRATRQIIRKQSRGSVSAQNGHYMSYERLKALSEKADRHMDHLGKSLKRA